MYGLPKSKRRSGGGFSVDADLSSALANPSLTNVFTIPLAANKTYLIRGVLLLRTGSHGQRFENTAPVGAVGQISFIQVDETGVPYVLGMGLNDVQEVTSNFGLYQASFTAFIKTSTTAGNFVFGFIHLGGESVPSQSAQVKAGSGVVVTEI